MISQSYLINSTASRIITASPAARTIYLHVLGNGIVYLGGSDVTTTNGMPLEKHTTPMTIFIPPSEELWAVDGALGETIRVLRPSRDAN